VDPAAADRVVLVEVDKVVAAVRVGRAVAVRVHVVADGHHAEFANLLQLQKQNRRSPSSTGTGV
jgi:flavin-dependent dehydrogenase